MNDLAIEIKGLTKTYKNVEALKGVDVNIKRGEFFGLLGPNGAGKTTTINILTGLVFRDKGITNIFGKDTVKHFRYTRSRVGIAAQEFSVDWFFQLKNFYFFMLSTVGSHRCSNFQTLKWFKLSKIEDPHSFDVSNNAPKMKWRGASMPHKRGYLYLTGREILEKWSLCMGSDPSPRNDSRCAG